MTYDIRIEPDGRILKAEAGANLLACLRGAGLAPEAPCGGRGTCGKCGVWVDGRRTLACQVTVTHPMTVRVPGHTRSQILVDAKASAGRLEPWSGDKLLAFDIGTTTVVGYLLDGSTGEELAVESMLNPQAPYGADVISRIQYAAQRGLEELTSAIRGGLSELTAMVCARAGIWPKDIGTVCAVGNPCMQQLFLGIPPDNLKKIPFAPVLTEAKVTPVGECLPECREARMLVVPDLSGYVGADTIACVLATELDRQEELTLLVDIGTNGEMVLGNRARMAACSTAAGPALEGANIRCGMRGGPGAIDHVWLEDGALRYSVIGGGTACGICGSGLIDAVAALLDAGILNDAGRLQTGETAPAYASILGELEGQRVCFLSEQVCLTQNDIRQVQLAKGAIAAGIHLLAGQLGIAETEIRRVLLAGAFGTFLNPASACRIGMLPPALLDRIEAVGNAAGSGAKQLVCDRAALGHAQALTERIEFIELAGLPDFQDCFVAHMGFGNGE